MQIDVCGDDGMKKSFDELFEDQTKLGTKIKTNEYHDSGAHIIIDQGQEQIAGYTDLDDGLFTSVPAIVFGDHTRVIKYVDEPFFLGADGVKVLRCKYSDANYRYLYYALKSVRIPNTGYNRHFKWLKETHISYPDTSTQAEIVHVLDSVTDIIDKRKQELSSLDDLIKARFVEMFGDMLINPMRWPEIRLDEVSDIVSGITKGRKPKTDELFEVPYMAVSNVKDGYIDWTTVKTILATRAEIEQYRLLPLDVLMTEGGDPDKLGRGAIIHEPPENCIHQNHIFRVRLNQKHLLPVFFAQYLQQQRAKRYFLGCAKQTTGIASINMKQLSALPVLLPSIDEQIQFAAFVEQIDKSKDAIKKSLAETQTLFDSLMQQYFG